MTIPRVASTASRIGKAALRIYANHLISFTAGVIAGSVQTLLICAAIWGVQ